MSIFDNLHDNSTYRRGYDMIVPMRVTLESEPTGAIRDYTSDSNEEFVVRLTVAQNYWANRVQKPRVQQIAVNYLAQQLYQDVLCLIPRLRLAIEAGSKDDAHGIISEMEKAMRP